MIKRFIVILLAIFPLMLSDGGLAMAQSRQKQTDTWIKISDDDVAAIYYKSNILNTKRGHHIVYVKAVYKTSDWQTYFAQQIGIRTPVYTTTTKAEYDENYSYVMVRQVTCYSKAGKQLYKSADDTSAGWGPVNASDPVGIVGEYLGNKLEYEDTYGY